MRIQGYGSAGFCVSMIQENEIIMLLLGLGVLVFMVRSRAYLRHIPCKTLLVVAYGLQLTAWVATVLEGFIFPALLNGLEHVCYCAGAVVFACWCGGVTRGRIKESRPS